MKIFRKVLLVAFILAIVLGISEKWYSMFLLGRYWENAPIFPTIFAGLFFPLITIYIAIVAIRYIVQS